MTSTIRNRSQRSRLSQHTASSQDDSDDTKHEGVESTAPRNEMTIGKNRNGRRVRTKRRSGAGGAGLLRHDMDPGISTE
ncbi:hypothetical protein HK097_002434, partial [Rhizophlyctis rosea]